MVETSGLIVAQALARGYDVSVLVRSAEKASDLDGAKLIVGDARNESALRQALKGRDAVISALGTPASPFREVTLLSSATRALVRKSITDLPACRLSHHCRGGKRTAACELHYSAL